MINFMEKVPATCANEIFYILDDIGVKQHYKGYNYLAAAISLVVSSDDQRVSITKDVYPYVADLFKSSVSQVERNIRFSIEQTFFDGQIDDIYKYFGNTISVHKSKPTNSQFIHTIANVVSRKMLSANC